MSAPSPVAEGPLSIAANLDVASATEAHALLVAALDDVEASDRVATLDLQDGTATPLALQLVVSATRAFPAERLRLGPNAAAALTALEPPKET